MVSNKEIEDIKKILKPFQKTCLLIKLVSETVKNVAEEQTCEFLRMLLGTIGTKFLRILWRDKCTIKAGKIKFRARKDIQGRLLV